MAEIGRHSQAREFWEACDKALDTGGMLTAGADQIDTVRDAEQRAAACAAQEAREARALAALTAAQDHSGVKAGVTAVQACPHCGGEVTVLTTLIPETAPAHWPLTANRHLLLSRLSALQDGPVSPWWISEKISRWKSTMTELRQDRILEEAATATRDPMHIATMFGLHPNTAQRYVDAAHGRHDPAPPTVAAGTAGRKGPSDLNISQYSNS